MTHFLMPAEWTPHAATWCAFPFNENNWPGILNEVRAEYAKFVTTIAEFEPVHLFINNDPDSIRAAHSFFHKKHNIHMHQIDMNDVWYRDNGPTFVCTYEENTLPDVSSLGLRSVTQRLDRGAQFLSSGSWAAGSTPQILPIKWQFNAWGQKFPYAHDTNTAYKTFNILNCNYQNADIIFEGGAIDVNGQGVALTTRQCLLNPNRNPNLTKMQIEDDLKKYLGVTKCIWLEDGLEDDHTDGHVDTIVRFVSENKILCSYCEDKTDPNYAIMQKNLEILKSENTNQQFEIIMLPLPKNKMFFGGKRLACTYANFYMSDQFVIVPMYSDPNDEIALNIFKSLFPTHKVFGLSSKYIICGGGSFHCLTQQQPAGALSSRGLTTGSIRTALIQMSMSSHLDENLEKAFKYIREAAQNNAKIILLPELFENLYFCQEKNEKYFALAHSFENHPFLPKFYALAKELNVVLPVSFFEKDGTNYFNSIAMINSDGNCLGIYRKTHIPDDTYYEEKFYFKPGDTGFKTWDTAYGKIGVGICWDQWFPECARAMTVMGADLLLYPTAIGSEPSHLQINTLPMWQKVMIGHAVANSVYIGAANRVGTEKNIQFYGSSFMTDYQGEKIAELNTTEENILYADCDFEKAREFRQWLGCLKDIR